MLCKAVYREIRSKIRYYLLSRKTTATNSHQQEPQFSVEKSVKFCIIYGLIPRQSLILQY